MIMASGRCQVTVPAAPLASLLHESASHRVVADVLVRLEEQHGVQAEAWLVDYPQSRLNALLGDGTVTVDDSWLGRCFAGQAVERSGTRTAFPMTTRGNRVGVLELATDELGDEPEHLAALLAQTITAVGSTTTVYEQRRRQSAMTVAAELQWALLPGQSYADADITLGGMLEPAYSIAGDAYDWTRDASLISLAVLDGAGRGIPAALATTLALGALRNARYTGTSLADQAALADQALYGHHGGEVFTSALLLQLDVLSGEVRVVDAGSPALFRQREGRVEELALEAELPLGMFEETRYTEQLVDVRPGDRVLIVSNGAHSADLDLEQTLRGSRLLPPAEVCRHLVRALRPGWGDQGPHDDAVVVCFDWHPGQV
jgi:serine phosphatase RsbU (regulator of sigma subunit)